MSSDPDLDDIVRAARGDKRAQSSIIRRHVAKLHAVAVRMTGDPAAAEDIVQETFVRAWRVMAKWKPQAKFSTWLHRVTLNLCYDHLRKRRDLTGKALPDHADPAMTPVEALDQAERVAAIEQAISGLPERQRAALVLCRLEGHTNIAAAEIMDVSVDALESLLARARRSLKATLGLDKEAEHG
ncbi:MAG: RNA polymerase sigma factor [Pseudomonadota bacterium]